MSQSYYIEHGGDWPFRYTVWRGAHPHGFGHSYVAQVTVTRRGALLAIRLDKRRRARQKPNVRRFVERVE